jgi:hypothetical protein
MEASILRVGRPCRFSTVNDICLTTEEKHGKPQSGWQLVREDKTMHRLGCHVGSPRFPVGDFKQILIGRNALQVAKIRGYPYHLTLRRHSQLLL